MKSFARLTLVAFLGTATLAVISHSSQATNKPQTLFAEQTSSPVTSPTPSPRPTPIPPRMQ
ncbi:hypothetical protein [Anabaena sp. PCC 7108]|uniref:hypothetical protein n=1 Tax=Anabaena sp. PCC 7108 TaxID=163908 RepID=UPI000346D750|nr:hypothetical protein [Anabaena sp. PCC 7108]